MLQLTNAYGIRPESVEKNIIRKSHPSPAKLAILHEEGLLPWLLLSCVKSHIVWI